MLIVKERDAQQQAAAKATGQLRSNLAGTDTVSEEYTKYRVADVTEGDKKFTSIDVLPVFL